MNLQMFPFNYDFYCKTNRKLFKKFFPSPFTIAVILTLIVFLLAVLLTEQSYSKIITGWEKGLGI